jgi:osmotically-inducible protein OsmY
MRNTLKSIVKNYMILLIILSFPVLLYAQQKPQGNSNNNLKIFVQYKLAKADLLNNNNINVEISGNKIILSGKVPTIFDKEEAEREAHSVDENYVIVNNILVKNKAVNDSTLTKEVMDKIQSNVFYGVFDWLTVNSNDGTVTLGGWVHWPWLKNQYETEVKKIPGVKSVINNIHNTFGPGELGFRAARLIYNDPSFWGLQYSLNPPIHIIVNNGSVFLFGDVNSNAEKYLVENLINFHTDAISVENDLKVNGNI